VSETKEWREFAPEIGELLELRGSPVSVTYSEEAPTGAAEGRFWACEAIQKARDGDIIDLTASSCSCYGGLWHLGLRPEPEGAAWKALQEFIVKGEKLFCSEAALHRNIQLSSPPPRAVGEHAVFSPLEKAEFQPDLVLFICNAEQACRLVTLDGFQSGIPPRLSTAGSACHQAVSYVISTGETNVSLLDCTARRMRRFGPDELIVSIPWHRFPGVMRSIDSCTAGRARMSFPKAFRRMMKAARSSASSAADSAAEQP
jgi:uncharacterized protein (DUF169 family)